MEGKLMGVPVVLTVVLIAFSTRLVLAHHEPVISSSRISGSVQGSFHPQMKFWWVPAAVVSPQCCKAINTLNEKCFPEFMALVNVHFFPLLSGYCKKGGRHPATSTIYSSYTAIPTTANRYTPSTTSTCTGRTATSQLPTYPTPASPKPGPREQQAPPPPSPSAPASSPLPEVHFVSPPVQTPEGIIPAKPAQGPTAPKPSSEETPISPEMPSQAPRTPGPQFPVTPSLSPEPTLFPPSPPQAPQTPSVQASETPAQSPENSTTITSADPITGLIATNSSHSRARIPNNSTNTSRNPTS